VVCVPVCVCSPRQQDAIRSNGMPLDERPCQLWKMERVSDLENEYHIWNMEMKNTPHAHSHAVENLAHFSRSFSALLAFFQATLQQYKKVGGTARATWSLSASPL